MNYYNFVTESIGEYKDIDDILSHWWGGLKMWWQRCKMESSLFRSLKEYPKETNLIKSVIKDFDVKVYAYPDAERNAFVIPGFYVGAEENYDLLVSKYKKRFPRQDMWYGIGSDFLTVLLSDQLDNILKLKDFKIVNDPKRKGKKQAIFNSHDTSASVFVSYGLLNDATPDQRLGIYLHEGGHWIDAARNIPPAMIRNKTKESCYLAYNMAYQRFCTRYQELQADRFAKILGYADELISGLEQLSSIRKHISWIYRFGDISLKTAVQQHNDAEAAGYTGPESYPSMDTRMRYLRSEENDDGEL